jgi:hypothetical protein
MITLRKIDVGSAFRIGALVSGILGLIFVLPWIACQSTLLASLSTIDISGRGTNGTPFENTAIQGIGILGFLLFAVCGLVLYMVIGGIGGAVSAFAYNLVARQFGGLQIEIDDPEERYSLPSTKGKNSFFDADFEKP